jgi:hypothetical protein
MPVSSLLDHRRAAAAASVALLLLLPAGASAAPAAAPATPASAIDALLKGSFPADRPGAAVIVVRHGRTLFRKAYGMSDLELGVPLQPDMVFRLGSITKRTPGYTREGDQVRNAQYLSMTQPYAAGSLASTLDDLARWDAALYGETLLKKASLEQAWTPYLLKDGKPTGYGYGWGVSKLRGRRAIEHGGGIFGFSTYTLRLPDERVFVAVLCNSDSPPADPGYLAKKIAALAVGDPFPEPAPITLEPQVLERYAGVYRIDDGATRTVTVENGRIYAQRSGGERLEVRPSSEAEFFYEKSLTHLRFVVDASGRATEMLMYPEGADEPERAPRVADAPAERAVAKVDPALYDAYVGEYEVAPGFVLTVTREGDRLLAQATGQSKLEIFPSSDTEFFLTVVDAQITFVRGPGGVDRLVLHQGGRDMPATKRRSGLS